MFNILILESVSNMQKISLTQYANQIKLKSKKGLSKNLLNKNYIEYVIENLCKRQIA